MSDTLLVITGVGVPPYSARGLTQTLTPISAASSQRRTINGGLVDLSADQFRKFSSHINCSDQQPPAFAEAWPGSIVVVDCVAELAYSNDSGASPAPMPSRPVVSGSERDEDGFTFYRPQLVMMVTSYNVSKDEYGAVTQWELDLEEI